MLACCLLLYCSRAAQPFDLFFINLTWVFRWAGWWVVRRSVQICNIIMLGIFAWQTISAYIIQKALKNHKCIIGNSFVSSFFYCFACRWKRFKSKQ